MSEIIAEHHFEWLNVRSLLHDSTWWNIYNNSFHCYELDTKQQLIHALKQNIVKMGRCRFNDETIAIAVVYPMRAMPFVFLNYLAVASHHRNRKIGSSLFTSLIDTVSKLDQFSKEKYLGLIWEVEDPDIKAAANIKNTRQRRIEFYQRQGAKLFNSKFIQPPIDGLHCVPFRLMFHSTHYSEFTDVIEKNIAKTIYMEKYHIINNIKTTLLMKLLHQCFPE